jgi:alpha-beta hydrolase superfamily lysophospholipase
MREILLFPSTRVRAAFAPAIPVGVKGAGRPVMVIPGFMASDRTTARLRKSLNQAGFACHGWGMGRNLGIQPDIFEQMDQRLSEIDATAPITLIGWSLGGLIAREYAKYAPDRVAKVITLGAPFSSGPRANNGWRLYEMVAGHKVDAPPLNVSLQSKPSVQTIAIWSSRDGMVAPCAARGLPGESDAQFEENCTHMGLIADPRIIRRIAKIIVD